MPKRIFKTRKQRRKDNKQLAGTRIGEYKLGSGKPKFKWAKPRAA